MFTVIIAEKEHLDSINEYSAFLKPFMDNKKIAFCQWNPAARSLAQAVPTLSDAVAFNKKWRAVILCDRSGMRKKNPFEAVSFHAPEPGTNEDNRSETDSALQYTWDLTADDKVEPYYPPELYTRLEQIRKRKFEAFDKASEQPLTRLVTYLCEAPMVTAGRNHASSDPEFAEYIAEIQYKAELRSKIKNGEKLDVELPCEVVCVARRTFTDSEYDVNVAWTPHIEEGYSRFYDWNMYFDQMRYLVFDLLPEGHKNYSFDYLRFLYAVLLLASNEIPAGAVQPRRVYAFGCENDAVELDKILSLYDAKLTLTKNILQDRITAIEDKEQVRLTDEEAESIFCSKITVPVTVDDRNMAKQMFARPIHFGLSEDCPVSEANLWSDKYAASEKAFQKYMKLPRRALKRAAADVPRLNRVESKKTKCLNAFQLEDVKDHIHTEEMLMVAVETDSFLDIDAYQQQMKKANKAVVRNIQTRMSKKTTVFAGFAALLMFLAGFIPFVLNSMDNVRSLLVVLLITAGATALLALILLTSLLFFRRNLMKLVWWFDAAVQGVVNSVEHNAAKYSDYLSHVCNVMRGHSVLNYREENEDPDALTMRVFEKHVHDIICAQEDLHAVFGSYMSGKLDPRLSVQEYAYDFSRPVDYQYPFPYSGGEGFRIEFMCKGHYATVPVGFVKRVTLRREELYDR